MLRTAATLVVLATAMSAYAQWQMQDSGTTAGLRGIHTVNARVAWASGMEGTVLRTTDAGAHWHKCAVPEGAEKLDFRGVWAWDEKNATVISSGPGYESRLYRTVDGCAHWTLEWTNHDKDGFWDALVFHGEDGVLIGDPVRGRFFTGLVELPPADGAEGLRRITEEIGCDAREGEGAFAASNSSVFVFAARRYVVGTGGKGGPRALLSPELAQSVTHASGSSRNAANDCVAVRVPVAGGNDSSGIFSIFFRDRRHGVAVGGDYKQPNQSDGTAAFTSDGGLHWTPAAKPPHGYRSSVTWDSQRRVWIAAGTNGSDISRDDGNTWQPLDDRDWNSLSLPFAVGPKGRIGKLALK